MLLSPQSSPSPSSFSLQPPVSPLFYPTLSPLLAPSASSASSASSLSSSNSSLRSTSPLLLSSSLASSSLSTARTLSTSARGSAASFLNDSAIGDVTVELSGLPSTALSSSHTANNQRLPDAARSKFVQSSSSSAAFREPGNRSSRSFHLPHSSSSLSMSTHGDERDEEQSELEQPAQRPTYHSGPLDVLPAVIESSSELLVDQTAAELSHSDTAQSDDEESEEAAAAAPDKKEPKLNDGEKRVSRACIHCSASKTKCDNKRPCSRCVRTKRAATCQDIPRRKRMGRGKRRREAESAQRVAATRSDKPARLVKKEEDARAEAAIAVSSAAASRSTTPTEHEMTSAVDTYSYQAAVAVPLDPYTAGYAHPLPYTPQPTQSSCDCSNHPVQYMPHHHSPQHWHPQPNHYSHHPPFHYQTEAPHHTPHPVAHPYPHMHPYPAPHSAHAVPIGPPSHYGSGGAAEPLYSPAPSPLPRVRTAPPVAMLSSLTSPSAASSNHTAITAAGTARGVSPVSPATAAVAATLPIGQLLSRLRLRLPRALHRAHAALIDQFHQWADVIALRQQQGLPAPVPILKARQYTYHMLKDALLALEDWERQRRLTTLLSPTHATHALSPPAAFSSPRESDHLELLRLIHQEWDEHLFPQRGAGAAAVEAEGEDVHLFDCDGKDKAAHLTLDAVLQRRVVTPTFIIPLLSFPFLTSSPWLSASFSSLLDYPTASLSASTHTPLDLLHHRQHADIAPLVPAFLAALTARADHYLHSSGWMRKGGDSVLLVANVRVLYAEATGYPVALMAQFARKDEADDSFAPILSRMGNRGTGALSGSVSGSVASEIAA